MKNSFKKIISLVLTVLMLAGTVTMLVPASAAEVSKTLTINTERDIKGVKVRLDAPTAHASSSLTLCPDGSVHMKGQRGDLFWLSNVELTADSVFTTTVTFAAAKTPGSCCAGTAYGIDANGAWAESDDTAIVAALRTNGRRSIALTNYGIATSSADFVTPELSGTLSYTVSNEDFGGTWQPGKTVTTVISQASDGTVSAVFTDGNGDAITSTSYNNSTYPLGGNVGFMTHWTNGSDYNEYTIKEFKITNAMVDEKLVDEVNFTKLVKEYYSENFGASVDAKKIAGNTFVAVNDLILRMDHPTPAHSSSSLTLCSDGTIKMKGSRGDLFWLSNVELTANSEFTTTVTFDYAKTPGSCCAGTMYNIDADGAWNEATDTALLATLLTNARRRIGSTDYSKATGSADASSIHGNDDYTVTNTDFGATWQIGKTVKTVISQSTDGTVTAEFTDGNGVAITSVSYKNASYPFEGNVGWSTFWTNGSDYNEYTIKEFKITNAKVNGVLVDEVDLVAEVRDYMNPSTDKSVTDTAISLSLDGTIGLNFAFTATNLAGATVVATKNGEVVATETVVDGANLITAPVNAKEMTDDVNFSIMVDGEVFDGKPYTATVKEYAEKLMADDNYNDWDDLMNAMLNYGAAAQKLLNYKVDEADVSGIVDYGFTTFEPVSFSGDNSILKGLHMNLSLESDTVLNLYFMPADGVTLTVTVNGGAAELTDNDDGYYVLSISGIAADKLADDFAIVVNGGELSFAVNALDWARIASESAETETLANALAAYADAAERKN